MKHIQTYETMVEGSFKYKFNMGDLVKLKYQYQDRTFKVIDRKNRMAINIYSVDTVDDKLDEEDFKLTRWPIGLWEYQSKIRNLTPEELEQYNMEQNATKYNL